MALTENGLVTVMLRYCVKMAKHVVEILSLPDSPILLSVFCVSMGPCCQGRINH